MITGHCECDAVQYQVDGAINDFCHCHCSQCRRLHGSAFATFGGVPRQQFRYLTGESDVVSFASSESHQRVFCGRCGSNILVGLEGEPDTLYLAMGAVDGSPDLPAGYHIFVGSKAPWYTINDELAQHDTVPEED